MRFAAAALALCVLVAVGAAPSATAGETSPKACPGDPSLGVVRFPRGGKEHVVSLATCTDKVAGKAAAWRPTASFRSHSGLVAAVSRVNLRAKRGTAAITVDGRVVYRVAEHYGAPGPILLAGWSPDSRWLLFRINHSASQPARWLDRLASAPELEAADGVPEFACQPLCPNGFRGWRLLAQRCGPGGATRRATPRASHEQPLARTATARRNPADETRDLAPSAGGGGGT